MKVFHNKLIQKLIVVALGLLSAGYFAWNFYYFGYWVGTHFLSTVFEGPDMLGYLCAALMFGAVITVFFYAEYMYEDVKAYSDAKGDKSFVDAFKEIKWWVTGLEVFSVLFRWYILNWSVVGFILLGAGLVLMRFTFVLGKAFHAQVNRPHEVEAGRIMEEAGRMVWEKGRKNLRHMNADQLRRVATGDPLPIDEVKDIREQERERGRQQEIEGIRLREQQNNKKRGFADKFLNPFPGAQTNQNQADALSRQQNGHRN